jgi:hypothetical protein
MMSILLKCEDVCICIVVDIANLIEDIIIYVYDYNSICMILRSSTMSYFDYYDKLDVDYGCIDNDEHIVEV